MRVARKANRSDIYPDDTIIGNKLTIYPHLIHPAGGVENRDSKISAQFQLYALQYNEVPYIVIGRQHAGDVFTLPAVEESHQRGIVQIFFPANNLQRAAARTHIMLF